MPKPKIIAVVGPTASGKTSLGIYLAQKLNGEVISADSRQVYKGLDIGTGKVTKKEMAGIPHHLLDVASPKKQFTVDDFVRLATKAYSSILQNTRIPIVAGGTGLYVDTFLGRMNYPQVPQNSALRKKLESKTAPQLFVMLQKLDPRRAGNIDPHNPRRLVRAIEIAKTLGQSPAKEEMLGTSDSHYDVLWLGLAPAPEKLKKNIRTRLLERIQCGMVEEAVELRKQGLSYKRMEELGLEYRYLAQLLQGSITKEEFVSQLERAIQDYAKRQMTWFKRNKDIQWVGSKTEALRLAKAFLSR
ncbi:MAG: tRNA dimethylallyltransferase [Candidatus Adlerbacteria bacterium]|nr:tRNA dimethylallyltransferase [Candidatus Adlerbacteria bacterium]